MKIIYENKSIKAYYCTKFFKRLKGFMFQKNINKALIFPKCNSVHTFFMKENIDIIMCDKNNNILYYYPNISKNKVILPKKKVTTTIETPPKYFNIKLNTKIEKDYH